MTLSRTQTRRLVGASLADSPRHHQDFYATEPDAARALCQVECFGPAIWEPACGMGHLVAPLRAAGYRVIASDLVDRGHGKAGVDFLRTARAPARDVVTNPPFDNPAAWIIHALDRLRVRKLALLLQLAFYAAQRHGLLDRLPPVRLHAFTWRVRTARDADFSRAKGMFNVAWFVWEAGHRGDTVIKRLGREVLA